MPIKKEQDFFNNSIPKMVFSKKENYYIPVGAIPASKSGKFNFGFKHICVYAFNKEHLHLF